MPEGLTGSLAQWRLADILQMLGSARQSGRLELNDGPHRAEVYLREGEVVHAASGNSAGESVMVFVTAWERGVFSFEPRVSSPETTITRPLADLLESCRRESTERDAIRKVIASPNVVPSLSRTAPNGPVTLSAEEWLAIAHIDSHLSIAEIASVGRVDDFALSKVLYRLVVDGLVEIDMPQVVRFPLPPGQSVSAHSPAPHAAPASRSAPVSPEFFRQVTASAAVSLGPLASVVVDDAVDSLGVTRETFTRDLVSRLVEAVAREITDERRRMTFQQTMLQWMRNQAA